MIRLSCKVYIWISSNSLNVQLPVYPMVLCLEDSGYRGEGGTVDGIKVNDSIL